MREQWELIQEYPEYLISDFGRVMNERTDRIKVLQRNKDGVIYAALQKEGRQSTRAVGLLVAQAFIDPPPEKRFDTIIHLDGDKDNCRAENLLWRPRPFAIEFHKQFSKDTQIKRAVRIAETGEVFPSSRHVSTAFGVIEKYVVASVIDPQREIRVWPVNYTVEIA